MNPETPAAASREEAIEREIVACMARGDEAALRDLHRRLGGRVFGFSRRMLGNAHEAEEATQDVFVRAWKRAAEFDARLASPWAWLAMMTRSVCIDRLRRRHARPDLVRAESLDDFTHRDAGMASSSTEPHAADLPKLLDLLRPVERRCVDHVFFEGLTQAETAIRTGLPLGTVKTHVRRGLERLRKVLSPHDS